MMIDPGRAGETGEEGPYGEEGAGFGARGEPAFGCEEGGYFGGDLGGCFVGGDARAARFDGSGW